MELRIMKRFLSVIALALAMAGFLAAQSNPGSQSAATAKKQFVFGGACKLCPWGAMAEVVKNVMQNYGYNVQICYNCNAVDSPRIVAEARTPPAYKVDPNVSVDAAPHNAPDLGAIDFGATGAAFVCDLYHGTGRYAQDKPAPQLRLLANIQNAPTYLIVAAKTGTGITDLSQVRSKKWPVRIYAQRGNSLVDAVLAYYNLSAKEIEAAGGLVGGSSADGSTSPDRTTFDLIIHSGGWVGTMPEQQTWSEVVQKNSWNFLTLPDPLLAKLAQDFKLEREIVPFGWLPGIDRAIPSVVTAAAGTVIYSRTDFPESAAYDVAKALDVYQERLRHTNQRFFYDIREVYKLCDVPLHPGAARYYKEVGYLK
jgi:uncharacterized protein